jgi:hypothetical protein
VENRLTCISNTDPTAKTQSFVHDYRSRRIRSTKDGVITHATFSGQVSAAEWTSSASATSPDRHFVRGVGMEGGVAGMDYALAGANASYVHYNGRGDAVATTDGTKARSSLTTCYGDGLVKW